jgi:hypothetical protein
MEDTPRWTFITTLRNMVLDELGFGIFSGMAGAHYELGLRLLTEGL